MARLLVTSDSDNGWYEELSVVASYSETDYESKIKQYADSIFQEYYTIRFKKGVAFEGVTKKPDLALISKDYSTWWVVEVELTGHSVSHVIEQVEIFKEGNYNPITFLTYIKGVFSQELPDVTLDGIKLERLLTEEPPKVLVIVDAPTEEWRKALSQAGASLCDLQVFKNTARAEAYKLSGDYPSIYVSSVHLKFHHLARNTLELIGSGDLITPLEHGKEITLNYKGKNTKWGVDIIEGKTYIKSLGSVCLLHNPNAYVLSLDQAGRYSILDS